MFVYMCASVQVCILCQSAPRCHRCTFDAAACARLVGACCVFVPQEVLTSFGASFASLPCASPQFSSYIFIFSNTHTHACTYLPSYLYHIHIYAKVTACCNFTIWSECCTLCVASTITAMQSFFHLVGNDMKCNLAI